MEQLEAVSMVTKTQAMAVLKKYGCKLDDEGLFVTIFPPLGYLMSESGCHCVCIEFENVIRCCGEDERGKFSGWRSATASEKWAEIIRVVEAGLVECTDPECDVCLSNGIR